MSFIFFPENCTVKCLPDPSIWLLNNFPNQGVLLIPSISVHSSFSLPHHRNGTTIVPEVQGKGQQSALIPIPASCFSSLTHPSSGPICETSCQSLKLISNISASFSFYYQHLSSNHRCLLAKLILLIGLFSISLPSNTFYI